MEHKWMAQNQPLWRLLATVGPMQSYRCVPKTTMTVGCRLLCCHVLVHISSICTVRWCSGCTCLFQETGYRVLNH